MTRINLVHPSRLADQHLFAEWREIKHIPAFLNQLLAKGKSVEEIKAKIPEKFCLNKGHKYFFVDKIGFLCNRVRDISRELTVRRYEIPKESTNAWVSLILPIPDAFYGYYIPDELEILTSNERIIERIGQRPDWYRYRGEIKDLQFFSNLLNS